MLSRGAYKTYIVAAPLNIAQIDKISMEWSRKRSIKDPMGWVKSPTIYIDRVELVPTYIQNPS